MLKRPETTQTKSNNLRDGTSVGLPKRSSWKCIRFVISSPLAAELNFTRASERCNVTQPSLSRAIKLLEEELGGPLFYRERDSTRLTDLGQMVRPHLQSVYDRLEAWRSSLSREFAEEVAAQTGDHEHDLARWRSWISSPIFGPATPEVELRLCDANAKDLRARLLAGELEVAIYALPGEEPDERIHSIPLFREQMVLAVHRGHRLAKTGAFPVREMNGEDYIHRMNCEFAGYTDQNSGAEGSYLQTRLLERAR